MRRRHLELGLRMQAVASAALQELEEKIAAGRPLNLSREDAETLRDVGAKLEREALGEKKRGGDDASIPSPKKPN
jgi:proline dehydrogenase